MNNETPIHEPRGLPEPERSFVVSLTCVMLFAGIIGTTLALISATRGRWAAEAEIAHQKKLAADALPQIEPRERANPKLADERRKLEQALAEKGKVELQLAIRRRAHVAFANLLSELDQPTLDLAGVHRISKALNADAIPDEGDLALAQFIIGNRLSRLGYSSEATVMLRKSFEGRLQLFGGDHLDTIAALNALALAYERSGIAMPDSVDLLEAARRVQTAKLGPEHPQTWTTIQRMAYALKRNNSLRESIALYEKLLDRDRARFKGDDWQLAEPIGNLADLHVQANNHREAVPLLKESMALHLAKHERDDPLVLESMTKLATAHRQLGDWQAVVPILEDILKIHREKHGDDHTQTQASLVLLAEAHRSAGDLDAAIPLFEQRLDHLKTTLGPSDPRIRNGQTNLAFALIEAKRIERAGTLLKEIVTAARKDSFAGKRGYAETLVMMGAELLHYAAYEPAEPMLRECLQIREKTDPNGWARAEAEFLLGVCLLGLKKNTDAEPILQSGFDDLKRLRKSIPLEASARLVRMLEVAVRVYENRENPVAAERWRRERDGFRAK